MTHVHWTLIGIALASLCMLDECAGAPVRRRTLWLLIVALLALREIVCGALEMAWVMLKAIGVFLREGWRAFVDCLCSNRDPL